MSTPTPAPLIAAQATADLRAGIEALRDECRARAASLRAVDSYAATLCDEHADALDALLREACPMSTWLHARWFEPHPAVPVEGSQHYTRWGALEAECAACGEALVSAVIRTSPERAR